MKKIFLVIFLLILKNQSFVWGFREGDVSRTVQRIYKENKNGPEFFTKLKTYAKSDQRVCAYMLQHNFLFTNEDEKTLKRKSWDFPFPRHYADYYVVICEEDDSEHKNICETRYPSYRYNAIFDDDPIFTMAATGKIKLLKLIYKSDRNSFRKCNERTGASILYFAVLFEQDEVVAFLTNACEIDDTELIIYLATSKNKLLNETVLHLLAKKAKYNTVLKNLLQYKKVKDQINYQTSEMSGSSVSARSTPLHYACEFGNSETVTIFLNNQADETLRNGNGDTALTLARIKPNKENRLKNIPAL